MQIFLGEGNMLREWEKIFIARWTTMALLRSRFSSFLKHTLPDLSFRRASVARVPRRRKAARSNARSKANSFPVSFSTPRSSMGAIASRQSSSHSNFHVDNRPLRSDRLIKSNFSATLRSSPMHQTQVLPRTHVRA